MDYTKLNNITQRVMVGCSILSFKSILKYSIWTIKDFTEILEYGLFLVEKAKYFDFYSNLKIYTNNLFEFLYGICKSLTTM